MANKPNKNKSLLCGMIGGEHDHWDRFPVPSRIPQPVGLIRWRYPSMTILSSPPIHGGEAPLYCIVFGDKRGVVALRS